MAGGFVAGLSWTVALGLPALYLLAGTGLLNIHLPAGDTLHEWADLAWLNLRHSMFAFAGVLALYGYAMARLRTLLRGPDPAPTTVAHYDHLLDLATGLFFGVGVIWTAIGMESALIHALQDPLQAAGGGAFSLLQRLVEGGILLALSTTVVGGVGGYLLRLIKTLTLSAQLQALYSRCADAPGREIVARLVAIEALMQRPTPSTKN